MNTALSKINPFEDLDWEAFLNWLAFQPASRPFRDRSWLLRCLFNFGCSPEELLPLCECDTEYWPWLYECAGRFVVQSATYRSAEKGLLTEVLSRKRDGSFERRHIASHFLSTLGDPNRLDTH